MIIVHEPDIYIGVALEVGDLYRHLCGQHSGRHDWIDVLYPFAKDQQIVGEQHCGFELELPGDCPVDIAEDNDQPELFLL